MKQAANADFLLGLVLDPKGGGDVLPKRLVNFHRTTWHCVPEARTIYSHGCVSLICAIAVFCLHVVDDADEIFLVCGRNIPFEINSSRLFPVKVVFFIPSSAVSSLRLFNGNLTFV
jgi:hypothetical protein